MRDRLKGLARVAGKRLLEAWKWLVVLLVDLVKDLIRDRYIGAINSYLDRHSHGLLGYLRPFLDWLLGSPAGISFVVLTAVVCTVFISVAIHEIWPTPKRVAAAQDRKEPSITLPKKPSLSGFPNIKYDLCSVEPTPASELELSGLNKAGFVRFNNKSEFTDSTYTVGVDSVMASAEIYDYKNDNPIRTIAKCFWLDSEGCFTNFPVDLPRRMAIVGFSKKGRLLLLGDERAKTGKVSRLELPLGDYGIVITLRISTPDITYTEGPFKFELKAKNPARAKIIKLP